MAVRIRLHGTTSKQWSLTWLIHMVLNSETDCPKIKNKPLARHQNCKFPLTISKLHKTSEKLLKFISQIFQGEPFYSRYNITNTARTLLIKWWDSFKQRCLCPRSKIWMRFVLVCFCEFCELKYRVSEESRGFKGLTV